MDKEQKQKQINLKEEEKKKQLDEFERIKSIINGC
jgi:hypothetical protein